MNRICQQKGRAPEASTNRASPVSGTIGFLRKPLSLSFTFLSLDSRPPGSGPLKDLNRVKPDFPSCQPHPFGIRYGSQYEQQQGGYPPGYSSGRGAGGNGPNLYSAYETSGHPAETSLLPKGSSRPRDRTQVSCIVSTCCTAEPPVPVERNGNNLRCPWRAPGVWSN